MAFLKFSRDKRGYEHFYLVQPANRRGAKSRPRILYWFRTPPNVKVGRKPFDADARRTLEARNPDVAFDWDAIANTPIPPFDTERWRERRRLEREARRAASEPDEDASAPEAGAGEGGQAADGVAEEVRDLAPGGAFVPGEPGEAGRPVVTSAETVVAGAAGPPAPVTGRAHRRRRQRRGRRGKGQPATIQEVGPAAPARGDEPAGPGIGGPTGEV